MSLSYSLFKSSLRTTIIESIFNEVTSKTSRYYHWLGKENSWSDFLSPFIPSSTLDVPGPPQDNFRYELHVRRDILTAKSISPSDVSYVVKRNQWKSGEVYDIYDDAYIEPIATAKSWSIGLAVVTDDIVKYNNIYYRVNNTGVLDANRNPINPPTHVSGTQLNGTARLTYITRDTVAFSGATSLEKAKFYVITSEFNVYKCIDNNNNLRSTIEPTTTQTQASSFIPIIETSDGYKWKFMYTIPVSLRNKFLTAEWIPVSTALTSRFYNDGQITKVIINNPGSGYLARQATGTGVTSGSNTTLTISGTVAGTFEIGMVVSGANIVPGTKITAIPFGGGTGNYTLSQPSTGTVNGEVKGIAPDDIIVVSGNGYIANNPYQIQEKLLIVEGGLGYTSTPTINFSDPTVDSSTKVKAVGRVFVNSVAAVTSGQGYIVAGLGSTTLAQWKAFFSALTTIPSVGQTITATATGSIVGGGTVSIATITSGAAVISGQDYAVSTLGNTSEAQWKAFFNALTAVPTIGQTVRATTTGSISGGGTVTNGISVISGQVYVISTLGNTSIAQWRQFFSALPTSTLPTVGQVITATSTGLIVGGGTVFNGIVNDSELTTGGYGYEKNPTITIDEPIANTAYAEWVASTTPALNSVIKQPVNVTINGIVYSQDIYYRVTAGTGQLGTTAPLHTSGSAINGGLTLFVIAKRAIVKPITVKTEAQLKPVIVNGQIVNVEIIDGGIGYTNATLEIKNRLGGTPIGTGASIAVDFSAGSVNSIQASVEQGVIPGTIEVIKMVDGGTGYSTATVRILGDGTGATAIVTSYLGGQIAKIEMVNRGQGYTWTDVVITGNGTGANARAIMSPSDGHGFNAVKELYATSLMFYSSISKEKNQGLVIGNDYRKAGLVRNIKQFNSNNLFINDIGSGCILIEGNFDSSKLQYDALLQKVEVPPIVNYKNYRIVEVSGNKILLSVFNNFSLVAGDQLIIAPDISDANPNGNPNAGYTFAVTKVTERTIDQFSGDLLFVSVREKFQPSNEQIITLRTVITI